MEVAMTDSLSVALSDSSTAYFMLSNPVFEFEKKAVTEILYVDSAQGKADENEEEKDEAEKKFDIRITYQGIHPTPVVSGNFGVSLLIRGESQVLEVEMIQVTDPSPELVTKSRIQHGKAKLFNMI